MIRSSTSCTALALAALALLAGCSSGTSAAAPSAAAPTAPPSSAAPPAAAPTTAPPATATAPPTSAAPAVRELRLVVSGGKVTGDTGLVEVAIGEPLRVTVTSDVADEVHVHGPGKGFSGDVEAGGTVTVEATETVAGRFEVELENSRRVLTRLQVR